MMIKYIEHARSVALSTDGVKSNRGSRFRLGSVIVRKKRIIATGANSYKTHPLLQSNGDKIFLHAEQQAMIRCGLDNLSGCDIYVARIGARGECRMAKPCVFCNSWIKEYGIRNVYYTTNGRGIGHYETT